MQFSKKKKADLKEHTMCFLFKKNDTRFTKTRYIEFQDTTSLSTEPPQAAVLSSYQMKYQYFKLRISSKRTLYMPGICTNSYFYMVNTDIYNIHVIKYFIIGLFFNSRLWGSHDIFKHIQRFQN